MESFPAELTHEGFVPRVDARVRVERGAAVEGFPALVAFVRFFLRHNKRDNRDYFISAVRKSDALFPVPVRGSLFRNNTNNDETIMLVLGKIQKKQHLYWFYWFYWFYFRQNYI